MTRIWLSTPVALVLTASIFLACNTSAELHPTPSIASATTMCDRLDAEALGAAVGHDLVIVAEASSAEACTFHATVPQSFDIAVRVEDSFEELSEVEQVFPGGSSVRDIGDAAYWSADVSGLWFEIDRQLYAVQLVGPSGTEPTNRDLAESIAKSAAASLRARS